MYFYTVQKIVLEGTLNTPFIYQDLGILSGIVKTIYYLFPGILSLIAIIFLIQKNKKQYLFIPFFTLVYYLFGIRPVTDYVHFIPLVSTTVFCFVVFFVFLSPKKKIMWIFCCILLVFIGFYSALFKGYYKWGYPLIEHDLYESHKRIKVFVDDKQARDIPLLNKYLDKYTNERGYIFINYYSPMIYFITNRNNPTPFDYISKNAVSKNGKTEVVKELSKKNVKIVLTKDTTIDNNDIIDHYIVRYFIPDAKFEDFVVWKRK